MNARIMGTAVMQAIGLALISLSGYYVLLWFLESLNEPLPEPKSRYQVISIEGCEFIQDTYFRGTPLIHKPNCPNHSILPEKP